MRVSREKFAANREKILDVAARLFREKGFDGIGVADIMKAAGLTHGGFYGHFASKEDLIAQATARAAAQTVTRWDTAAKAGPAKAMEAVVERYLSARHRDHPGNGCVYSALGADVARQKGAARSSATRALQEQIAIIEPLMAGEQPSERRLEALATLSTLVGAMVLARLSDDENLSQDFLEAGRAAVLDGKPQDS